MTRLYASVAAVAVVAMLGGLAFVALSDRGGDDFAQCRASTVAGGAGAIGGPFTLVDQTGRTVTEAEVITRPSLVYFGYTFCPDICPLDTARNADAVDALEEMGHEVTPVFISVDPARDTPEVLADYAEAFHPRMIALSGSEEQVREASQAYRTYYNIHESEDEFYLVDHSTFTYLMLPEVGFVEFFRRDASAEQIADKTACYLRAS